MKLLSLHENQSAKQAEVSRDSVRIESVRTALLDAQTQLDEVKAKFDMTLAKQQRYLAEQEEKYLIRIEALSKEVKVLEERKKVAHFPIAPAERKAYDNLEKSKELLLTLELQKKKNEELEETITDKLLSLSEKDEELYMRENKVKDMEKTALDQHTHLKFLSESLATKWSEFHAASAEKATFFGQRERELELHEIDLNTREDAFFAERELVRKDKEKIASDRKTLQAAFQELRRKTNV